MAEFVKWCARLGAALTGAVLALVVPVHAWAAGAGADTLALEAARSRRRTGFFLPLVGGVCCLLVVGAVILAFVLISRNRKRR